MQAKPSKPSELLECHRGFVFAPTVGLHLVIASMMNPVD
jgi:hypothetical protein